MTEQDPINIAGTSVAAGSSANIEIPVARLYSRTPVAMPVQIVHGNSEGPRLFVTAAVHGDEILGVEVVRRLLRKKILKRLKGTLVAVPVVNVFGFNARSRYMPDRRDLNRFFPGSRKGSLTSQLARILVDEVISKCTHGIDLHSGSNHRINFPQIRACLDAPEVAEMARAFEAPVILDMDKIEGTMRAYCQDAKIPVILYEGGEADRFDELSVRTALRGVLSVMRHLKMLPPQKSRKARKESVVAKSHTRVRAPASGIFHDAQPLGATVTKGQTIGVVSDPGGGETFPVTSKVSGIVIGRLQHPLVNKGDSLYHIGMFSEPETAAGLVEDLQVEFDVEDRKEALDW